MKLSTRLMKKLQEPSRVDTLISGLIARLRSLWYGSEVTLYFDGSCEPVNPRGHGTAAWVIERDGQVINEGSIYLGYGEGQTNNVSEVMGLINGLHRLLELGLQGASVTVKGDSLIVIRALKSKRKVSGVYAKHVPEARELAGRFKNIKFQHIPRALNSYCDSLTHGKVVNALDQEFTQVTA